MRGSATLTTRRGGLRKTLLVLLVVLVLGVLLYRSRDAIGLKDFDWAQLGTSVATARWELLLLSLAAIYGAYAIRAQRWVRFSRYVGNPSFWSVYEATLVGFTAVFLLGRAGEPLRPILIARKDRMPVSSMFGIYVLERIFDVAATVIIAALSLLFFPRLLDAESNSGSSAIFTVLRSTGVAMLVGLVAAIAFLVYFRVHGAGALARRLERSRSGGPGWRARAAGLFQGFSQGIQAIRTPGDLGVAVGYSTLHWALVILVYVWICRSFGGRLAEIDVFAAMLVLAFSMVGSTVMLPGVGGGSQAACFLALTLVLGVEKEPAAAASIVIWLLTFAGSTLAGVPLLIREGWSMGELRRLAHAEAEAEAAGTHVSSPEAPLPMASKDTAQ